jgi:hypothetical protein
VGIILYLCNLSKRLSWLILIGAAVLKLLLAWHATGNFWRMTADLGYQECFPGAAGCPPLPAEAPSWWELFFSF